MCSRLAQRYYGGGCTDETVSKNEEERESRDGNQRIRWQNYQSHDRPHLPCQRQLASRQVLSRLVHHPSRSVITGCDVIELESFPQKTDDTIIRNAPRKASAVRSHQCANWERGEGKGDQRLMSWRHGAEVFEVGVVLSL